MIIGGIIGGFAGGIASGFAYDALTDGVQIGGKSVSAWISYGWKTPLMRWEMLLPKERKQPKMPWKIWETLLEMLFKAVRTLFSLPEKNSAEAGIPCGAGQHNNSWE